MPKTETTERTLVEAAGELEPEHARASAASAHGARVQAMFDRVGALQLETGVRRPGAFKRRARWPWVLLLLLLAGGGFVAYALQTASGNAGLLASMTELVLGPPKLDALVLQAESPVPIIIDTAGYLIPKATVQVSPNVAGTIIGLPTELGQRVNKGDLLAVLDDVTFRADFERAKSEVALAQAHYDELVAGSRPEEIAEARALVSQAEVRLALAESELTRAQALFGKKAMPVHEFEQIKARRDELRENVNELNEKLRLVELGPRKEAIAAAAAELARNQAMLAKTQFFFESTRVTAPIDGTILQLQAELGETVRPEAFGSENGLSTSLCVMADLNELEVEIDVPEQEVHQVHLGQYCEVTIEAAPDRLYEAEVSRRTPVANRQRGVVVWRVKVLKPDEYLLPYMNCRVLLYASKPTPGQEPVLRVPREALFDDTGAHFVWLHDGQHAIRRAVEVQESSLDESTTPSTEAGEFLTVVSGLKAGDVVLLPGDKPLTDGQAVRVQ